jgi:hypothetical protein
LRRRRSIRYPQGAGETVIGLAPIEIARPFFSCFLGFCLCYFKLFQKAKISLLSPAAKPHLTTYLCIPRDSGEMGTTLIPLLSSDSTEKTWLPLKKSQNTLTLSSFSGIIYSLGTWWANEVGIGQFRTTKVLSKFRAFTFLTAPWMPIFSCTTSPFAVWPHRGLRCTIGHIACSLTALSVGGRANA